MELREASESLIAPGFTIQVLGKNGTKSLRAYHQDDLCFYQGSLRSRVNSSVALSTCTGMVSLNMHRVGLREGLDKREGVDESDLSWCAFASVKRTHGSVNLKCISWIVLFYLNFGSIWIDLLSEYYNCTH